MEARTRQHSRPGPAGPPRTPRSLVPYWQGTTTRSRTRSHPQATRHPEHDVSAVGAAVTPGRLGEQQHLVTGGPPKDRGPQDANGAERSPFPGDIIALTNPPLRQPRGSTHVPLSARHVVLVTSDTSSAHSHCTALRVLFHTAGVRLVASLGHAGRAVLGPTYSALTLTTADEPPRRPPQRLLVFPERVLGRVQSRPGPAGRACFSV